MDNYRNIIDTLYEDLKDEKIIFVFMNIFTKYININFYN